MLAYGEVPPGIWIQEAESCEDVGSPGKGHPQERRKSEDFAQDQTRGEDTAAPRCCDGVSGGHQLGARRPDQADGEQRAAAPYGPSTRPSAAVPTGPGAGAAARDIQDPGGNIGIAAVARDGLDKHNHVPNDSHGLTPGRHVVAIIEDHSHQRVAVGNGLSPHRGNRVIRASRDCPSPIRIYGYGVLSVVWPGCGSMDQVVYARTDLPRPIPLHSTQRVAARPCCAAAS